MAQPEVSERAVLGVDIVTDVEMERVLEKRGDVEANYVIAVKIITMKSASDMSPAPPTSTRKSRAVQTFSSSLHRSGSLDNSISVKDLVKGNNAYHFILPS